MERIASQNILLIVVDSLRADHLSGLGYPLPTSPFLDSLMERSAVFDHFFTPVTPTQPAITTLFTGQFPWVHGIVAQSGFNRLAQNAPWLSKILARNGYVTAAIDNLVQAKKWFAHGFKDYINLRTRPDEYYPWSRLNPKALQWIDRHSDKKWFLYIRYGDPHTPYEPPPPYDQIFYTGDPTTSHRGSLNPFYARPLKPQLISEWLEPAARRWPGGIGSRIEDIEWVRAQYDGAIRSVDDGIKEMIEGLDLLGLQENTIVVVVGDHGQSLGEHDIYFEHHGLYECCLRPPLIIHWPGVTKEKRDLHTVAQLPDLAPTLIDMVGLAIPPAISGRSLAPLVSGGDGGAGIIKVLACESTWMCKWALRTDRYKVIVAREPDFYGKPPVEIYDLVKDPLETVNLAESHDALREQLVYDLESSVAKSLKEAGQRVDPVAAHGTVRDRLLVPRLSFKQRVKKLLGGMGKH